MHCLAIKDAVARRSNALSDATNEALEIRVALRHRARSRVNFVVLKQRLQFATQSQCFILHIGEKCPKTALVKIERCAEERNAMCKLALRCSNRDLT